MASKLLEALTYDGRRSAADLARITGRKPATVRRQVARLVASGVGVLPVRNRPAAIPLAVPVHVVRAGTDA